METFICPHCQQPHPANARFCPATGQRIEPGIPCPHCGLPVQPAWQNCPRCGARLGAHAPGIDWQGLLANRKLLIGAGAALLLIVIVLIALSLGGKDSDQVTELESSLPPAAQHATQTSLANLPAGQARQLMATQTAASVLSAAGTAAAGGAARPEPSAQPGAPVVQPTIQLALPAGQPGGQVSTNPSAALPEGLNPISTENNRLLRQLGDLGSGRFTITAFSQYGHWLAAATETGAIVVWDWFTGSKLLQISGLPAKVQELKFSANGVVLLAVLQNSDVRAWDTATGQELLSISGELRLGLTALSPDGSILAAGDRRGRTIRVIDVRKAQFLRDINVGDSGGMTSIAFTPDGTQLLGIYQDNLVRWDLASGEVFGGVLVPGARNADQFRFSPDGSLVAVFARYGVAQIISLKENKLLYSLDRHNNISDLAFGPDGTRMASIAQDMVVRIWDATSGTEVQAIARQEDYGYYSQSQISYVLGGAALAVGGQNGTLLVFRLDNGTVFYHLGGHNQDIYHLEASDDQTQLATAANDGSVRTWDLNTGQMRLSLPENQAQVNELQYSPDGSMLAAGLQDGSIVLWNVRSRSRLGILRNHDRPVTQMAYAPNGATLAAISDDGILSLWDTASQQARLVLNRQNDGYRFTSVTFSPDSGRMATTYTGWNADQVVSIWDANSGVEQGQIKSEEARFVCVKFSPDGAYLAAGMDNWDVKLWELASGGELRSLKAHGAEIQALAFSPDGARLASAAQDGVKVWDLASGLVQYNLSKDFSRNPTFSADGQLLAAGSGNQVYVWDVATGSVLANAGSTQDNYRGLPVALSPDRTLLAYAHGWVITLMGIGE